MPENLDLIHLVERIHNKGETKNFKLLGVVFDRTSHLMIIQYKRLVCQKNLKIYVLYELNKKFS